MINHNIGKKKKFAVVDSVEVWQELVGLFILRCSLGFHPIIIIRLCYAYKPLLSPVGHIHLPRMKPQSLKMLKKRDHCPVHSAFVHTLEHVLLKITTK